MPPTRSSSTVLSSELTSSSLYLVEHLELVADELLRPVALLAGLARRAQVVDRRRDRRRIEVEGDRDQLPGAGELGLDEPAGARADVAVDAAHAGVGAALEGGVLGRHHRVAGLAAEGGGVHHLDRLVGGDRHDHDVDDGQGEEEQEAVAGRVLVEVEDRELRARGHQGPPRAAQADRDQQQPGHEQARDDQVGEDAEVGVAVQPEHVEAEEDQEDDRRGGGDGAAGEADRVAGERGEEALQGPTPRPRAGSTADRAADGSGV